MAGLTAVVDGAGRLEAASYTHLVVNSDGTTAAVFGPLSRSEATRLASDLRTHGDPDACVSDLPWAAVVSTPDGAVHYACSTMLPGGIYVAEGPAGTWSVSTNVMSAATAAGTPPRVNLAFLRDFNVLSAAVDQTPLRDVVRVPGGETHIRERSGRRRVRQWCGPNTLPPPNRTGDGVIAEYLETFDTVVDSLAERTATRVATLSGGLDSTFVVASLTRSGPVHALCHAPVVGASTVSAPGWEADDLSYAQLLAAAYPGTITVEPIRNTSHTHPLDAAAALVQRQWWPVAAPANAVWMSAVAERADELGAAMRFYGVMGNASFSSSHNYAFSHYLRRGRLLSAWSLLQPEVNGSRRSGLRRQMRMSRPRRVADQQQRWLQFGIRHVDESGTRGTRSTYAQWLTGRQGSNMSAQGPAAAKSLHIDPYASRSIIELAASISPATWQKGHSSRALARRLGEGRVPDGIRLRTTRGGQAHDAISVMRAQPDRLLDSIKTDSSAWDDLQVDTRTLAATAERFLAPSANPPQGRLQGLLRIVATAEYLQLLRFHIARSV